MTSGTSAGSASVTSAHCNDSVSVGLQCTTEVAHVVDGGTVLCSFNDLDRNVVANIEC